VLLLDKSVVISIDFEENKFCKEKNLIKYLMQISENIVCTIIYFVI